MKVLFAASELASLAKTGGLADVAAALPKALFDLGVDVRVVLPAYRGTLERLVAPRRVVEFFVRWQRFTLFEGTLPGGSMKIWLLDCPELYARDGDPYGDGYGSAWSDNPWRFGCFGEACARLACDDFGIGWRADLVHCNDWQTGLIPAWLSLRPNRPRTLFTIHNLAYQGCFSRDAFTALGLPEELWSLHGVEYHGNFSFMKAGLALSDQLTTVSPSYAEEITTPAFGEGFDGLLRHRRGVLRGILNGIDDVIWDPSKDPHLPRRYRFISLGRGKRTAKRQLQHEFGLAPDDATPLVGVVGRLAHQKGMDLVLEAAWHFLHVPTQLVLLASGDKQLENGFDHLARHFPGRVGVRFAHDERLAHLIEAGADIFLMPSRYEPCGLNQMYSQRYGTIPVVRSVGGLRDTVVDATPQTIADGTATGVRFDHADSGGVLHGVERAIELYRDNATWRSLQGNGMRRDFSWQSAAKEYVNLYEGMLADHQLSASPLRPPAASIGQSSKPADPPVGN